MRCLILVLLVPFLSLSQSNKFYIYEYGFPDLQELHIKDSLGQKWKVEFRLLSGCVVNEKFIDSVKTINEETYKLLDETYKINWLQEFEKELAHYYDLERKKDERETFERDSLFNVDFQKLYPDHDIRVKIIDDSQNKVIYRGYHNLVTLIDQNHTNSDFTIQAYNVTVESFKSDVYSKNTFVLKPGTGKQAKILIFNNNNEVVAKHEFSVKNLTPLYLHIGNSVNGEQLNLDSLQLSMRFPQGISLQAKATIKSWEMKLEYVEEAILGTESDLKKYKSLLKKQKKGSRVDLICKYASSDGIQRTSTATFYL